MSECTHDCSTCSQNCASRQQPESLVEKPHELSNIKKVIGVVSGKGGVGKSTVAVNLAVGGYVEEIIFRGFLFRAMEKDNLRNAIIVSAITFGAGHIVNVFNTADIWGVLLQVGYAIVIGFLYTVILCHKPEA